MVPWLKSFFTDKLVFEQLVGNAVSRVRALVFALGLMLLTGQITLDRLGEQFGPLGYYIGMGLMIWAVMFSAGDHTEKVLERLTNDPEAMSEFLNKLSAGKVPPK